MPTLVEHTNGCLKHRRRFACRVVTWTWYRADKIMRWMMEKVGFVVIQPKELLRIIPTVTIIGVFPLCVFREEDRWESRT